MRRRLLTSSTAREADQSAQSKGRRESKGYDEQGFHEKFLSSRHLSNPSSLITPALPNTATGFAREIRLSCPKNLHSQLRFGERALYRAGKPQPEGLKPVKKHKLKPHLTITL